MVVSSLFCDVHQNFSSFLLKLFFFLSQSYNVWYHSLQLLSCNRKSCMQRSPYWQLWWAVFILQWCGLLDQYCHIRFFFSNCFTVFTALSVALFACGYLGLLVTCLNPYSSENIWNIAAENCGPLSDVIYSGIPWWEKIDFRCDITLVAVIVISQISNRPLKGNLFLHLNRFVPTFCHNRFGSDDGIRFLYCILTACTTFGDCLINITFWVHATTQSCRTLDVRFALLVCMSVSLQKQAGSSLSFSLTSCWKVLTLWSAPLTGALERVSAVFSAFPGMCAMANENVINRNLSLWTLSGTVSRGLEVCDLSPFETRYREDSPEIACMPKLPPGPLFRFEHIVVRPPRVLSICMLRAWCFHLIVVVSVRPRDHTISWLVVDNVEGQYFTRNQCSFEWLKCLSLVTSSTPLILETQ